MIDIDFYQKNNEFMFEHEKLINTLKINQNILKSPVKYEINLTNKCNQHCLHCSNGENLNANEITVDMLKIIMEYEPVYVVLTGGEPLLNRNIFKIIKMLKKNNIFIKICTNGTLLNNKNAIKLKESGMDSQDIIQISFGAINNILINEFQNIGELANKSNILIFASCHDSGYMGIPAQLDNYIPVLGASIKGQKTYLYKNNYFICHGGRQRIAWINPDYIFGEGSSFATARLTGIASLLKEKNKNIKNNDFIDILKNNANNINSNLIKPYHMDTIVANNSEMYEIKKATIFSFTKEMHHLFNFSDLTNIKITDVVDLPFKATINKRISELVCHSQDNLKIISNLEKSLLNCDTLIISKTSVYEGILQKDITEKALLTALKFNKNIYSLEYIDINMYPTVFKLAKEKNLKIRHPIIGMTQANTASIYRQLYGHISNSTPIVGIFGTGTSQGKFTTQLTLRRLFKQYGYNVCNYGTETHSELFGFEGYYPLEMDSSVRILDTNMIEFIQGDLRRIEIEYSPDIIFVGGQSGTIPFSYSTKSREYTLPTLSFLMATIPHLYLLNINLFDEYSYIEDTINVIQSLGKARVIALLVSKRTKKEHTSLIININNIDTNQYSQMVNELHSYFNLPIFDITDIDDQKQLVKLLIKSFS